MLHKGTLSILAGLPLVVGGVVALKFTGLDLAWVAIAGGALLGTFGGVQLATPATSK